MRQRSTSISMLVVATLLLAVTFATATGQSPASAAENPSAHHLTAYIGNATGTVLYPVDSPEGKALVESIDIGVSGPFASPTPLPVGGGIITPLWTVGAGWYLYIYLNSGDINWLLGLGYTQATAAICFWLTATILGGLACATVAYVVWGAIQAYRGVNKPGYCLEISINYATGTLHNKKWVRRSC